jgi:hypothetical protein
MSRETLLDAIAGREAEAFDRTIDVYVGRLRRKIAANPKQPPLIVTVPGVGYRLAAQPRGPRTASRKRYGVRTRRRSTLGPLSSHPINRANSGCDARARSAPYAEDATVILADRILFRAGIYRGSLRTGLRALPSTPIKARTCCGDGSDVMLRAGSWSGTYQGPTGLVHQWGSWTTTNVLHGTT